MSDFRDAAPGYPSALLRPGRIDHAATAAGMHPGLSLIVPHDAQHAVAAGMLALAPQHAVQHPNHEVGRLASN